MKDLLSFYFKINTKTLKIIVNGGLLGCGTMNFT